MSAELEEVVVASDALQAQQLGPDIGQGLFDGALRRLVGLAGEGVVVGCGQGLAVELAVGGQR